jgi:hypothetical protein
MLIEMLENYGPLQQGQTCQLVAEGHDWYRVKHGGTSLSVPRAFAAKRIWERDTKRDDRPWRRQNRRQHDAART